MNYYMSNYCNNNLWEQTLVFKDIRCVNKLEGKLVVKIGEK
jgi:hypothetical protein